VYRVEDANVVTMQLGACHCFHETEFEDSRCNDLLTKCDEVSWMSSCCLYTDMRQSI
jgi:hypothetical protein